MLNMTLPLCAGEEEVMWWAVWMPNRIQTFIFVCELFWKRAYYLKLDGAGLFGKRVWYHFVMNSFRYNINVWSSWGLAKSDVDGRHDSGLEEWAESGLDDSWQQ